MPHRRVSKLDPKRFIFVDECGTNTCATVLLGKGVHAKFVQELLGHATISITLDTYSHVLPGMGDAAAGVKDEALG